MSKNNFKINLLIYADSIKALDVLIRQRIKDYYYERKLLPGGRMFLLSLTHPITGQINIRNLIPELLADMCLGGALTILFGLKRKKILIN